MMNKNIGLFFGSFNPIHIGHVIIANHLIEYSDLNEIWFVVSPQNPLKDKKTLLAEHLRYEMVQLVCEEYPKFRANSIEFSLPKPSYTIDTLTILQEKYPQHKFTLLLGEDNLHTLHKWKNYETLLKKYDIIIYPRITENITEIQFSQEKITKIEAPIIEISSTQIRKMITEKKNIKPLLTEKVFHFIDGSNLYK